jgi:hypothetical protein
MQAFCFGIQWLLLVFVDVLHVEAESHQILSGYSPLNVEIRRPSADAGIAGVREDRVRCYSRDDEADIAAPDGAVFRFLQVGSYYLEILLHAVGYPDATSLPPSSDRFVSGSNCVVEGHGQAE